MFFNYRKTGKDIILTIPGKFEGEKRKIVIDDHKSVFSQKKTDECRIILEVKG